MKKVIIEMENGGVMTGELYEDIAPITVENFEKLAKDGFYDGLTLSLIHISALLCAEEFLRARTTLILAISSLGLNGLTI